MTTTTSPYRTPEEAMEYLRLTSRRTLSYLMKERGLPYVRCGGRLRFDTRELDAWLRGSDSLTLVRAERQQRRRA